LTTHYAAFFGTSSPPVSLIPDKGVRRAMPDERSEWFLAQAEQCARQADEVRDEGARSLYKLLARQWRRLAEEAANRQAA
jgi:hypothetical protein